MPLNNDMLASVFSLVDGNLGFGVTPALTFDIQDSLNGEATIRITNVSTGTGAKAVCSSQNDNQEYMDMMMYGSNVVTYQSFTASRAALYTNGANGLAIISATASAPIIFAFGTYGGTEVMRILDTTRVGIGVPAPSSRLDIGAGALTLAEMSAPNAPGGDQCIIYSVDNGAGKTQLMVRFPTGAAQQLAIEA